MRSRRPDSHNYALPGLQHFHFADNEGPATGHRRFSLICQMDTGNTTFRHVLLIMFFTFGGIDATTSVGMLERIQQSPFTSSR
jgi:hypothetical protein